MFLRSAGLTFHFDHNIFNYFFCGKLIGRFVNNILTEEEKDKFSEILGPFCAMLEDVYS